MTRATHAALKMYAPPGKTLLSLDGRPKAKAAEPELPLPKPEPTGKQREPITRTERKQRIRILDIKRLPDPKRAARLSHALAVTDADRAHFRTHAHELADELGITLKHV